MKFTINLNQEKLIKLEPRIRLTEAAVLDYLYCFCASPAPEVEKLRVVEEGLRYTWIDYDWVIKEMPLLKGRTKRSLVPIIVKLEEWGFIKTIIKDGLDGGDRKYVCMLPKAEGSLRKRNELVTKAKRVASSIYDEPYTNEHKDIASPSATPSVFNLKEEITKLKESKQRHIQLIGEFLEEKGVALENATQLKRAIGRHLRAARELADFSDKQIAKASEQAQDEYPKIWQLETLIKLITK